MAEVKRQTSLIFIAVFLILVLGLTFLLKSNGNPPSPVPTPSPTPFLEAPLEEKQAGEILKNPENFYGKKISVIGNLRSSKSDRGYILENDKNRLFILTLGPLTEDNESENPFSKDEKVIVIISGEVKKFIASEIKEKYNVDLEKKIIIEFTDKPFMVAEKIEFAP